MFDQKTYVKRITSINEKISMHLQGKVANRKENWNLVCYGPDKVTTTELSGLFPGAGVITAFDIQRLLIHHTNYISY